MPGDSTIATQIPHPTIATVFALDDHIAAMGHALLDMTINEEGFDPDRTYRLCLTCGAEIREMRVGPDVDARLLAPCVEPEWVSYTFDASDD